MYKWSTLICALLFSNATNASKLFLILLDGFRWDYFDHPQLQLRGFPRLFRNGVKAEYMTPDFPTNSFPNYRTLETGLHVENHGIVGNFMYDEDKDIRFYLNDSDRNHPSWYDHAEAFYITGEKQGRFYLNDSDRNHPSWYDHAEAFYITGEKQGIRSALYYWRGCQVPQGGWKASFCVPHRKIPTVTDIHWALQDGLVRLREDLSDIVYLYHEEIDHLGHYFGPNSGQVLQAIQDIDRQLDTFLDDVEKAGLNQKLDIMIVSDHGMSNVDALHMLNLTSVIDMNDIHTLVEAGSQSYVWPKKDKERQVYESLKDFSPHLKVFYKENLHDRWFLKKHRLIPPIFLLVDPGWYLIHPTSHRDYFDIAAAPWRGNHGFDNTVDDMRAIFIARGPSFKKGYAAKPFSNVNVYQLICHVTNISPEKHNGTWTLVQDILRESPITDNHNEL